MKRKRYVKAGTDCCNATCNATRNEHCISVDAGRAQRAHEPRMYLLTSVSEMRANGSLSLQKNTQRNGS